MWEACGKGPVCQQAQKELIYSHDFCKSYVCEGSFFFLGSEQSSELVQSANIRKGLLLQLLPHTSLGITGNPAISDLSYTAPPHPPDPPCQCPREVKSSGNPLPSALDRQDPSLHHPPHPSSPPSGPPDPTSQIVSLLYLNTFLNPEVEKLDGGECRASEGHVKRRDKVWQAEQDVEGHGEQLKWGGADTESIMTGAREMRGLSA
jgi:hypothetical protein